MPQKLLNGIARFWLFGCLGAAAFAQVEVGSATLNGTVTDPSGASVSGANVRISGQDTGLSRETSTTDAGFYSFTRLPVGVYTISIDQPGFKSVRSQGLRLSVGAVVAIDIALQLGQAQDVVSVTAEAPVVETSRSGTATNVNEKSVADLPVNGRNFIDFTVLTPGVVRDASRSGDLSFGGQRGPANSLLVDGGESNNVFFGQAVGRTGFRPYSFSQDAVQEFQVNSNDYPAEIGRSGGGVINVITKSGTNQLHGSAFEFFRDKSMNANTFINNRDRRSKPPYHFNQFGGSLGGPIVKDKLFFFGNYDGQRNTAPEIVVVNIPVPASLPQLNQYLAPYQVGARNDVGLAKVDWNIGQNDRLSVRYNVNRFTGKNYENANLTFFSSSGAAEHTGNSQVTTDNVAVSYTRVFGSRLVFDSRYIFIRDNEPGLANSNNVETVITNGPTFGRNNFSPRYTNAKTSQIIDTLSLVKGRHSIKFGLDFNIVQVQNFFPGLFSGSYTFASYAAYAAGQPSQFQQAFAGAGTSGPLTKPNVNEYAGFVQDSWRASDRLTLTLGVRYDFFDYAQPGILNQNAQLLAANLRTNTIRRDKMNFAPRLGFAFKPLHDDTLVVRGGYGIFYERTPTIVTGTAFSQNGIQVLNYTLVPGDPAFPAYPNVLPAAPPLAPPNLYIVDGNYRTPRVHQYSFNIEKQVWRDASVTVGYLGVHGQNLTRTRDINLFPSQPTQGTLCADAACASSSPVAYFRHPGVASPVRPNAAFGRLSVFESAADSSYNGLFVQFVKRYANNFTFLASYTWSKVIDDVPDATAVVVGTDDAKAAQDSLQPNRDRGPGNADVPHRFVFSAVWDMPYAHSLSNPVLKAVLGDWQVATISQLQSGRRFSALVTGDPNNDGNRATDRPPFLGRNTLQVGKFMQWDLRLSRDFPLHTERMRLRLLGEAFNITNRANFNTLQANQYGFANGRFTPATNFLLPQSTYDPRIIQLAAKIIF